MLTRTLQEHLEVGSSLLRYRLLGGMLEEFVSARAGNALDSLAKLLPDHVTVRRNGEDLVVPLEEVQNSDLVLIRSGERIPVDGVIAQGTASINQSAITGESLAVEKQPGDTVFAGTLNELGRLKCRQPTWERRPRSARSAAW
jgi:Zn2+/Cd2+-exporting ATPase